MVITALGFLFLIGWAIKYFAKTLITGADLLVNRRRFRDEKIRVKHLATVDEYNVMRIQTFQNVYHSGRTVQRVKSTRYEVRFDLINYGSRESVLESGLVISRPYGFIDNLEWKSFSTSPAGPCEWVEYSHPRAKSVTTVCKAGTSRADLELVALVDISMKNFKRMILFSFAMVLGLISFLISVVILSLLF